MSENIDYQDTPWLDPDAEPFIQIKGVTKQFGDFTAVNSVDLDIFQGGTILPPGREAPPGEFWHQRKLEGRVLKCMNCHL